MAERPLEGKRIAVLVETEFIPHELAKYEEIFSSLGARVEFLANVRPNRQIHIVSDVDGVIYYKDPNGGPDNSEVNEEETRKQLKIRAVTGDITEEFNRGTEYAAVLVAANYTSVRLRYFPNNEKPITPDMVRTPPAGRFVARAIRNPKVVVGALCHGLWLFSPMPELIAGRRVICHEVVLADVLNAGASYAAPEPADLGRGVTALTTPTGPPGGRRPLAQGRVRGGAAPRRGSAAAHLDGRRDRRIRGPKRTDSRGGSPRGGCLGQWREVFNSDSASYGGDNVGNGGGDVPCWAGRLRVVLPAAGFVVLHRL